MKVTLDKQHAQREAPEKDGVAVNYAPAKRVFPWIRWLIVVFLITSPLLYILFRLADDWFLVTSPAVVSLARATVSMPTTGKIDELSVALGTPVSRGDVLMRATPATYTEDLRSLERLRARARDYDRTPPPSPPTVPPPTPTAFLSSPTRDYGENIALALRSLDYWTRNRQAYEELRRKGAATEAEYREALEREQTARAALIQLREAAAAAVMTDAPVPAPAILAPTENRADILARMDIDNEIALLEKRLAPQVVTSPVSGNVARVLASTGQSLPLGATVLEIVGDDSVEIQAFADERAMDYFQYGSAITVELPGKVKIRCEISDKPVQTGDTPSGMAKPFTAETAIMLRLKPLEPLPGKYRVDGLPVTVRWGVWMPDVLRRVVMSSRERASAGEMAVGGIGGKKTP